MQIFGLHKNIYKLARYASTQELLDKQTQRNAPWNSDQLDVDSKYVINQINIGVYNEEELYQCV